MKKEVLTQYAIDQERKLYNKIRKSYRFLRKALEDFEENRHMLKLSISDLSANLILSNYSDDIHEPIDFKYKDYIAYHKNNNTHHLNVYKKGLIHKEENVDILERLKPKERRRV